MSLLTLVALLLVLRLAAQLTLNLLNRRAVLAAQDSVPAAFAETMDPATYTRSVRYTLAKNRLGRLELIYEAVILALVIFTGLLPWAWSLLEGVLGTSIWGQAAILFIIGLALGIPNLPWEWYDQFVLEERFGFNRSTQALWWLDKIKGLAVGFVLGFPLLAALLWTVNLAGSLWWIWAFALFFLFQLIMMVLYPAVIMPLFNKFEELPLGDLRERLMALADRTGFAAKTILVMDGSRRSAHANAFFSGFGSARRVVLFDTLIDQLGEEELEGVLAHEIGHYRLGHIPRMLAFSAYSLLVSFALLGWLAGSSWFLAGFGFEAVAFPVAPTLLVFGMLSGLLTFWLTPLTNILSRKHEYEADAFAKNAAHGDPFPLIRALRILSAKNLSNLTPHPLFSAFYYSHPTLVEREASLTK